MSAERPTIAVFTKNRVNPAYHAARLGAARTAEAFGATTVDYVPEVPDDIDEQIALLDHQPRPESAHAMADRALESTPQFYVLLEQGREFLDHILDHRPQQ